MSFDNVMTCSKERNPSFDIMKGICILLMIVGHCHLPSHLKAFVYSFHMPVFLFIAGYFFKSSSFSKIAFNGFKRLIVPYFATCLLCSLICLALDDWHIIRKHPFSEHIDFIDTLHVIMPIWFLLALFWGRLLLNTLLFIKSDFLILVLSFFISIFSVNLATYINPPLIILPALSSVIFLTVGYMCKKYDLLKNSISFSYLPLMLIAWLLCFIKGNRFDIMANIINGFLVLDVLAALGVWLVMFTVVSKCQNMTSVWKFIEWCGKYSLILLCVHSVEINFLNYFYVEKKLLQFCYPYASYVIIFLRVIMDVFFAALLTKSKFLMKYIFGQKV